MANQEQTSQNNQVPHTTVFTISYVVYQQLPDGNFHPSGVDKDTLQLSFDAENAEDAMQKSKKLIEELRDTWAKNNQSESKPETST
jgi:hypothetical protein